MSTTSQNENVQVTPKKAAGNLGTVKGFRSELGTVSEDVPGYDSSSLNANSKDLHGTGAGEVKERKNDNNDEKEEGATSSFSQLGSKGKEVSPIPPQSSVRIRGKDERGRGDDISTLRLPEEAPTPARIPPPSSYNNKKPVTYIPAHATGGSDEIPGSSSTVRSSSGPSANSLSEAKTPLAKHDKFYGRSSSGNGGSNIPAADSGISPGSGQGSSSYLVLVQSTANVPPPTPTPASLPTQLNQQILHTPTMHNNNSSSSSSSSSSNNNYTGSKLQNTPLSPGFVPLNPNPNNQHRGYLDVNNRAVGEFDKSKVSSNINQKNPDFESFLRSYKVPDPSWARDLDLNVSSLLMHSSDSQVFYNFTNHSADHCCLNDLLISVLLICFSNCFVSSPLYPLLSLPSSHLHTSLQLKSFHIYIDSYPLFSPSPPLFLNILHL